MAYENQGPFTLTAGEDLEPYRLVKLSAGTAVYADAGDEPIGRSGGEKVLSGALATVSPLLGSVLKVTASKAISAGSAIYGAADGKVSDAAVGKQIGVNLAAASANLGVVPAVVWGPRSASDFLSSKASVIDFFDDFFSYDPTATVGHWTVVTDAGGTQALADGAGGLLSIGTFTTDNDETYLSSMNECFKFAANKALFFEASIKLTEANTDDANWIIGLSDTVAADSLQNNGAGPMASYDGAVFFKVDGTMKIQFETSNAGAQVTNATLADFVTATTYKVGLLFDPNDGVTGKITPFVDGVAGATHDITLAGLEEMHVLMGAKAGGANAEALVVDYVHGVQAR